ncbi:hypothetical protein ZWY2020_021027 [Hordeum vulgare]|nr:hypothetical protein ZWY2020_021027 [Hordeum vulgare]
MLLLLALLLLSNGVGNVDCSTIHENSADLHALLDFKQGITNDPQGALNNWNTTTTHFCHWNDFGIASLIGHSSLDTSMGLKGTLGYIPPEYAQSGQASIHGDVYSFGIDHKDWEIIEMEGNFSVACVDQAAKEVVVLYMVPGDNAEQVT